MAIPDDIRSYNDEQPAKERSVCEFLAAELDAGLPEAASKLWHAHPVWFLAGNPVAGYAVRKDSVQLLFWSGQSFDEPGLQPEGTFKAAQRRIRATSDVDSDDLRRWIGKARDIQWDYKNIRRDRGRLVPLTPLTPDR